MMVGPETVSVRLGRLLLAFVTLLSALCAFSQGSNWSILHFLENIVVREGKIISS